MKIKVFIASPGGLEEERELFRETLADISQEYQTSGLCDYEFTSVGWEDTSPTARRSQSVINELLDECHFYVQILHRRWGSTPHSKEELESGALSEKYSSGTEEEFSHAENLLNDTKMPMIDIALFFKDVSTELMADPGPQFKKVKEFRENLEETKSHHYSTYDKPTLFTKKLRILINKWVSTLNSGKRLDSPPKLTFTIEKDEFNKNIDHSLKNIIQKAWDEANAGHLTNAEILFSKAIVRRQFSVYPITQFARYLALKGHMSHAESLLKEALNQTEVHENINTKAGIYSELGNIYRTRSELSKAEEMFKNGMSLLDGTKYDIGYLSLNINLINIYELIKPDEVESMSLNALKDCIKLGYSDGLFYVYTNLGKVYQRKYGLDKTKEMYEHALNIAI